MAETPTDNIKLLTARTLKWNTIDKVLSQVLYAVTGIILANVVSKEEFGLVGSILIFQAFASLFVDSGFSFAIIHKKKSIANQIMATDDDIPQDEMYFDELASLFLNPHDDG